MMGLLAIGLDKTRLLLAQPKLFRSDNDKITRRRQDFTHFF
jgi:hypothetical protein